jgi:hypothetical protein
MSTHNASRGYILKRASQVNVGDQFKTLTDEFTVTDKERCGFLGLTEIALTVKERIAPGAISKTFIFSRFEYLHVKLVKTQTPSQNR